MLLVCLGFTAVSAIITFFYRFEKISYSELARQVGYEGEKIEGLATGAKILDSSKSDSN